MRDPLNTISYWSTTILICLIVLFICIKKIEKDRVRTTNSVELHTIYKNYIVLEKYSEGKTYVLKLQNPITTDVFSVGIPEWVYYNLYFVGDTIK